jgi:hypothetical protein
VSGFCAVPRSNGLVGREGPAAMPDLLFVDQGGCRRRSASSILATSCEVRKPSKKWRNGTRPSAWPRGRSRHVVRFLHRDWRASRSRSAHAITSEWSPKIDSAWVASVRAATCMHERRQLAGDLVHVRDHQQQALRRGEGRGQRTGLQRTVHRAGGAGPRTAFLDIRGVVPQMFLRPLASPTHRNNSPMGLDGVIG